MQTCHGIGTILCDENGLQVLCMPATQGVRQRVLDGRQIAVIAVPAKISVQRHDVAKTSLRENERQISTYRLHFSLGY